MKDKIHVLLFDNTELNVLSLQEEERQTAFEVRRTFKVLHVNVIDVLY